MDISIPTTFPTPGLPAPRIVSSLSDFPVRFPSGCPPFHLFTQTNRWFCCQCAHSGYRDPIGMVYSEAKEERCFRTDKCGHLRCGECALGPDYDVKRAVRTVAGRHFDDKFLKPVFWECHCGEWKRNGLGVGICANPGGCPFRWRVGRERKGSRTAESVVLNCFGERLGTADQAVVLEGGRWHLEAKGRGLWSSTDGRLERDEGARELNEEVARSRLQMDRGVRNFVRNLDGEDGLLGGWEMLRI